MSFKEQLASNLVNLELNVAKERKELLFEVDH